MYTCFATSTISRLTLRLSCHMQVMSIVDGINGLDPEVLPLACTLASLYSMCITAMSLNRPLQVTLINTTMT